MAILVGITLTDFSYSSEKKVLETPLRAFPDNLYGIDFADSKNGLISGYYGTVLKTADGGLTWHKVETGFPELLRRVRMVSPGLAFAVTHRGAILKSEDGGSSWQSVYRESGVYLRDLSFHDAGNGWVVGHDSYILHTKDGGKNWERQKLEGYNGRDLPRLHGVVALSPTHAIAVGEFGVVTETIDAGAHWNLLQGSTQATLTAIDATEGYAIAIGLDGEAMEIALDPTLPSRIKKISTGQPAHLFDIALTASGRGVAVGRAVLLSIQGETFSPLMTTDDITLPFTWFGGVTVGDDGEVWAVGQRGLVAHAVNSATAVSTSYRLGAQSTFSAEAAHVQ